MTKEHNVLANGHDVGRSAVPAALWGLALATCLLSGCEPALTTGAGGTESAATAKADSVEQLGLMRSEAADVSSSADWESWFVEPWKGDDGVPAAFDAVRYTCDGGDCTVGEQLRVDSCAALFQADSQGLDVEGMDEPQAGYLYRRLVCYAGRGIAAMRDATTSHVSDYELEAGTLSELPAELGYPVAPDQFEDARRIDAAGGGLGGFLEQVLGIVDSSAIQAFGDGLRVDDEEGWTREWLLMGRGDLDGDGVEDLLVGVNLYITDEALRFGSRLYAVTREESGAPMRLVYEIPILGSADACSQAQLCATFLLPKKR